LQSIAPSGILGFDKGGTGILQQDSKPFAEVVESGSRLIVARCTRRRDKPPVAQPPPFGSLVRVEGAPDVAAVVHCIKTTGFDPARKPEAFGLPLSELYEEYPELPDLLITEIEMIPVAFLNEDGQFRQGIAPTPPPLHAPVYPLCMEHSRQVFEEPWVLRLLADSSNTPEELLIQTIRRHAQALSPESDRQAWIQKAGRQLARIYEKDYSQLRYLLDRLEDY
jgi:hypothetical protein